MTTIGANRSGLIAFGGKVEGDRQILESGSQEASTLIELSKSTTMICPTLFPNNHHLFDTNIFSHIPSMTSMPLRDNLVFLGQNQKKS